MLQNLLIEGTGGNIPPEEIVSVNAGPRAYSVKVKQGLEDVPTNPAICLIGYPINQDIVDWIRLRSELPNNYGAVFIPHSVLKGVDRNRSKAIVGDVCGCYVIRGLLPAFSLQWEMTLRGYLAREGKEGIVYVDPEDFSGLKL